jgi:hypothetical protein
MSSAQPEYGVNEATLIRGEHGVIAEPDNLRLTAVVAVGIAALILFALGTVWAYFILRSTEHDILPDGPGPVPVVLAGRAYEVGIVNQWQFDRDLRAGELLEQQRQQLSSYGWVDRPRGLIHVPIERSMKEIIEEHAREGKQQEPGMVQPGQPPQGGQQQGAQQQPPVQQQGVQQQGAPQQQAPGAQGAQQPGQRRGQQGTQPQGAPQQQPAPRRQQ